jgi:CRP-like cAMP-binding protein
MERDAPPSAARLPGSAVSRAAVEPLLQSARRNGLFSMLSESDAEIVFSVCHFSFVEKDVQLFGVGDRADYLLFIADGRVDVWCSSANRQVLHVGMASTGAILGESAITVIGQRSAAVTTAARCALGYLLHEDFNRLWTTHPETALRFLVMMFNEVTKRMHAMVKQLTEATQVQAAAKTSQELLSRVLFDRRVGAPRPPGDGAPPAERRQNPKPER